MYYCLIFIRIMKEVWSIYIKGEIKGKTYMLLEDRSMVTLEGRE